MLACGGLLSASGGFKSLSWFARAELRQLGPSEGEFRTIHGAIIGQTGRHSMLIYAHAHSGARMKEGTRAHILCGFGAFFCPYCSTIRVCNDIVYAAIAVRKLRLGADHGMDSSF